MSRLLSPSQYIHETEQTKDFQIERE